MTVLEVSQLINLLFPYIFKSFEVELLAGNVIVFTEQSNYIIIFGWIAVRNRLGPLLVSNIIFCLNVRRPTYPMRDSNPQPQDYLTHKCLEVLRSIQLSQSGQVFTTTAGFEPAQQFANRLVIYRLNHSARLPFVSFRRSNNSICDSRRIRTYETICQ